MDVVIVNFDFVLAQPAFTYFKINNGNTRAMCEICSKLTIKTSERSLIIRINIFILTQVRSKIAAG